MERQRAHVQGVLKGQSQGGVDVSGVPLALAHPPRFQPDDQRLLAYLDEHGYAVVSQVAGPTEVARSKQLLWDFLEQLPGATARRDCVESWADWLPSGSNGILHGFGFGQSEFMWSVRMLPAVKRAFEAIWETDDLLVSFDGGNAFRPWRYSRDWLTDGGWYHVDQNALRPGMGRRACVQGLVTLCPANAETGGLVVIPGSHKKHTEMCARNAVPEQGDFVSIPLDDEVFHGSEAKLICAEAGDLILWDSRTIHCNTPAPTALAAGAHVKAEPSDGEWSLIRMVGYVCMTPAAMASEQVLRQRCEGFEQNVSCSHWPHRFVVAGHPLPDTPQKDLAAVPFEQRALIGSELADRYIAELEADDQSGPRDVKDQPSKCGCAIT